MTLSEEEPIYDWFVSTDLNIEHLLGLDKTARKNQKDITSLSLLA